MIEPMNWQRVGHMMMSPKGWAALLFMAATVTLTGCEQKSEADHLQSAQEFIAQNDVRAAIIEYKSALQLNPENPDSRFALGKLHLEVGDGASAEKELRRVVNSSVVDDNTLLPMLASALLLQGSYRELLDDIADDSGLASGSRAAVLAAHGDAYLGLKQTEAATASYEQALALDAAQPRARLGQAKLLLLNGDTDAARARLDELLAADPNYDEALFVLGQVSHNKGEFAEAEQAYTRLIDNKPNNIITPVTLQARLGRIQAMLAQSNVDSAAAEAEFLATRLPRHPLPKYFQGLIQFQRGDNSAAEKSLIEVINILPSHKPSLLLLGSINYAQGDMALADEYLSKFVASTPSHVQARKLLAATRMKLQQPDLAMEAIGPVLEGTEGDTQALALAGSAALRAGDVGVSTAYLEKALAANPDNASIRTELALAYLAEADMDKALKELEAAAEGDGVEQTRAGILLALTQLRNEEPEQASLTVQGLIDKSPDDATLHNLQGIIADQRGETAEARQLFERALGLNSAYTPAAVNLARIDQREGRIKEAQTRYEQVLVQDPDNVSVMLALAQIADRMGDTSQALNWLKAAAEADKAAVTPRLLLARYQLRQGNGDAALRLLNQTVIDVPDSTQARFNLGLVQTSQGNHKDALTTFDGLLQLDPEHVDAHFQKAVVNIRLKEFAAAKVALQDALAVRPNYTPAASLMARLAISDGDPNAATKIVSDFKRSHDDTLAGHVLEGDVYMMQKNYTAAITAYRAALAEEATESTVTRLFGAYSGAARIKEAQQVLQQWLVANPDNYKVRMRLAGSYLETGLSREAVEQYSIVTENRPRDALALNNLAWLYQQQGDPRALSLAEQAHEVKPDDPGIADTLGWILVQQGDAKRGLKILTEAAEKAPGVADIRYHLAVALAKTGDNDKARDILVDLVNDPSGLSGGVADVQELLNQL